MDGQANAYLLCSGVQVRVEVSRLVAVFELIRLGDVLLQSKLLVVFGQLRDPVFPVPPFLMFECLLL